MNKLIITVSTLFFALTNAVDLNVCKIDTLESYGFDQVGNIQEHVCYNPNDYTDFVIIKDYDNKYKKGIIIFNTQK